MKHKFLLALTLFCASAAWSAEKAAPAQSTAAAVKPTPYPLMRVGDIAPEISLPLPDKTTWTLRARRNLAPVLLVLTAEEPILVSQRATQAEALMAILEAAADLKKAGVETVLISKAIGVNIGALNKEAGIIGLRDEKGELARLFNVSQTALTVVAIDRMGFMRAIDSIRDIADVAPRMMKLADTTPEAEIGKAAPDFSITDCNGNVRRLADLRGRKNLLLTFFPQCFVCANQMTSLRAEQAAYEDADTEIWAVSIDPAHSIEPASGQDMGQAAFAASIGADFPFLPDPGRNLCFLYGTVQNIEDKAARWTFLIDKDGILRYVEKDVQSHIHTHGADMLKKMKELGMVKE